jgi:hypothetical protein
MIKQTLLQEFYDLKAEVLKRMKPGTYLYIYEDTQKGSGISLGENDLLMNKFSR